MLLQHEPKNGRTNNEELYPDCVTCERQVRLAANFNNWEADWVLLDRCYFALPGDAYERFVKMLDNPPRNNV